MIKYESLLEYKKQKRQLVVYSSIWLKKLDVNWIAKMTAIFLEFLEHFESITWINISPLHKKIFLPVTRNFKSKCFKMSLINRSTTFDPQTKNREVATQIYFLY